MENELAGYITTDQAVLRYGSEAIDLFDSGKVGHKRHRITRGVWLKESDILKCVGAYEEHQATAKC